MPANVQFPHATYRYSPYGNYRFRVRWNNAYVAGVSRVSGLERSTEVITHRDGAEAGTVNHMPGQTTFAPITLERGVTHDRAFEQWANKVWDYRNTVVNDREGGAGNQDVSLKDFRKDITIELYNEAGQKVLAYNVFRCWPSSYHALPELDSTSNGTAIETLVLQNEGWERDAAVHPPAEPSFTDPSFTDPSFTDPASQP